MSLNIPSLTTKSQRAFSEFLPKRFGLLALFQSTWSLPVVTRPYFQTCSWGSRYRGSLFHVAVLLSLIFQKQINTTHPVSHRAKLLAAFLLECHLRIL